ncbi:aminodeoxychorismate/anthranilate synthase component II [Paratractidigestivibacter sp.]|uniref:anthranilate synthase component II n=1 Tax=Paratractidigestivibacter sp. TaxID=2847316 RepID=UPI002ABD9898|nr:aminodeoxychorismate/anthranilate synthase component II [Paratractidigestivibacter sp.]
MIVLIDNYDSFSYNLYQLLGGIEPDIRVLRNDAVGVSELAAMEPAGIVLSPGPGRPADAGICEDVVRELTGRVPILGVCLGHQAICEALGGTVTYAAELMHGKSSMVDVEPGSRLFAGLPAQAEVARYHSLEADEASLPACLRVTARTADVRREVMAVEHVGAPTFGVQFHPESILTPDGQAMAKNFVAICRSGQRDSPFVH